METFYNGLLLPTRLMLDASVGGALLNKSYAEAYDLIESIAANSYQWPTSRLNSTKKVAGVHELNDVSNGTNSWAIQWATSRRSTSPFEAIFRSGKQFQSSGSN